MTLRDSVEFTFKAWLGFGRISVRIRKDGWRAFIAVVAVGVLVILGLLVTVIAVGVLVLVGVFLAVAYS